MNDPLLNVRNFRANVSPYAISNVHLEIYNKDRCFIQGRSGSGKTTFLKALGGLLPSSGTVEHQPQIRLCYFSQRPVFLPGTVEDNLKIPFQFKINSHLLYDRNLIADWLEHLGFETSLLNKNCRSLSGGEGQIIHFLRGLQLSPSILLLDEPTSSLDPSRATLFENFLLHDWLGAEEDPSLSHVSKPPRAILMVSHDPSQVRRIANKIYSLDT